MATTAASKYTSRLRSRVPSVKNVPERKFKPRKDIINSRNSKKVNVSIKNKSLRVSKGNISLRKSQISPRCLRPRRNRKNYCENSKLLPQYVASKQQDSIVILDKLNLKDSKKIPVYKTMGPSDKFSEDKNDVYDFKFDINNTKEKAKKKKKKQRKKNVKKESKTKKMIHKKVTQTETIGCEAIESPESNANLHVEIAQSNSLEFATPVEREDTVKKIEMLEIDVDTQMEKSVKKNIGKEIELPIIDTDIQVEEKSMKTAVEIMETSRAETNVKAIKETISSDRLFAEQKETFGEKDTSKPRIVSIENADNIIVTKSSPNKTEDAWPFRPKNIFDNKTSKEHNRMLKHSLLETLSPILKTTNTYDLGSPWRQPMLTFSQTKHFVQSTPYTNFETNKENKEINKKNLEMNKENVNMNKENKGKKERIKKTGLREKNIIQKKLPILENQIPEKVQIAKKSIVQPARISLGEIKNLLQKENINEDNKQTVDQTHTEVDESLVEQKDKQLGKILNFSDTFDVMSETERLSNIGNDDVPLFMDLEPSHFLKPPRHSYRRKRGVRFDFTEDSEGEEEKENVKKSPAKKKKLTKVEKEQEKRINEWVKTVNSTFQEIDEHDLIIE